MSYDIWPGIGLSTEPVEWTKVLGSAEGKAKSTANVERRRQSGNDFSTFRGMSKKSDATTRRGPPSTMRRGTGSGNVLMEDSKCGRIRASLRGGSLTRAEICAVVGIRPDRISAYLKNDIRKGRILKIVQEGCLQRFALAGVV